MNLGLCIVNLLRRYPAVWVPGIGVFKVSRTPASFDPQRSVFLPPTNRVELAEGQAMGYPITDYVRTQRKVDEATAMDVLDKAVKDVFDSISRNGRALLDGLGYLAADGATLVLQPFGTDGFGMKAIKERTALEPDRELRKPEPARVENEMPADEVAVPAVEQEVADDGAEASGDELAVEDTAEKRSRPWIIVAVIVPVLLAAAGWVWYTKSAWVGEIASAWFDGQPESQRLSKDAGLVSEPQESPVTDGGTPVVADSTSITDSLVADGQNAATDSMAVPEAPKGPSITYEIIVGSFATMAQAKKYVAEMKTKGYDLKALDSRMPGNRKKISWGSYATEEEAYRELARVQKNFEPGAWIAKIEHD